MSEIRSVGYFFARAPIGLFLRPLQPAVFIDMPEVSRFFGIVIRMYFFDHDPPQFHAGYGSSGGQIRIEAEVLLHGTLPPRALAHVLEWASIHRAELLDNWRRLHEDQPPERIAPLE